MPLPSDLERHITGEFTYGSLQSLCVSPCQCVFFCFLTPCAIFAQRRRLLAITKEPYVCCAGTRPFCGFQKERSDCWLIAEVCLFPHLALAGNRFMVQTRFNKRNSGLDNVLKIFHCCVSFEFCLARICCTCSTERENICKSAECVGPCSFCQNAAEIDTMVSNGEVYSHPPYGVIMELPVHFQNAGFHDDSAPTQQRMS